ncbi:MAG: orotate phosphoribosyltransferase [Actinomycetota bacterium]
MNPAEIREVLERRGALQGGHFLLSSGRHSDLYIQKFRVFEHPRLTQRFGDALAELFPEGFDVVASPAVGAVVLGFATALAAEARMIFAEREEGSMSFRRGFALEPHERVLVVEDVMTTGGSAREIVELVRGSGAKLVGVAAFIERADPARDLRLGVPTRSLLKLAPTSWAPEQCPLCSAHEPLVDPGSRRLGDSSPGHEKPPPSR